MQLPDVLFAINKGATVAELSEKFRGLVQSVRATGKGGSLALTLKVAPAARGDVDILTVDAGIKVSAPEADHRKNIFFSTEDGELCQSDPNQMELPLRPRAIEVVSREVSNG